MTKKNKNRNGRKKRRILTNRHQDEQEGTLRHQFFLSLECNDDFRILMAAKKSERKGQFPVYKYKYEDVLTDEQYDLFCQRVFNACLQLKHCYQAISASDYKSMIGALKPKVIEFVIQIEKWHRNNTPNNDNKHRQLHNFHRYGTACALIGSENFHREDLLVKNFRYHIEGSPKNHDVMQALMMLSNPFYDRKSSPQTRENDEKNMDTIMDNAIIEIEKADTEPEDNTEKKFQRKNKFCAIFSCTRVSHGEYKFTFNESFKEMFEAFMVAGIKENDGWKKLGRRNINDQTRWLLIEALQLSNNEGFHNRCPSIYSFAPNDPEQSPTNNIDSTKSSSLQPTSEEIAVGK